MRPAVRKAGRSKFRGGLGIRPDLGWESEVVPTGNRGRHAESDLGDDVKVVRNGGAMAGN